ncbi:sporulation inhibitor of replication protein SirA [Paenisporosarcina cavernae]|uniref:sporulation inhibitor of replication protein SirA n=1 Tax=Paenisporosarcina cavernae TaxID=2320858 RepID=UPI0013C4AE17|nr:sporulation inhibitor of replication protein SirA [Paenisporosarcina cavernae]
MREYIVIHVKEEYVPFIHGKENHIHELFTDTYSLKKEIPLEFMYVCKELYWEEFMNVVASQTQEDYVHFSINKPTIFMHHPIKGEANITIFDQFIHISCKGNAMLDLDIFSLLSKTSNTYFAFQKNSKSYGWLRPIKHFV